MPKTRAGMALIAFTLIAGGCDGPRVATDAGPGDAGGDVCEGRTTCATAGSACTGDSLVTCAPDADGCLIETTTDCGMSGQICDASGASPACVDPCAAIPAADRCDTDGARACDGETLEVCAADADGCLVLERTDCAASAGGTCDETGAMPMCQLPPDPCEGVPNACTTAGTSCSGDSLVECAPDAFGCLVETSVDCSSRGGGTCDATATPPACVFTGDPCAGVTECATAGATCEGPVLVECAPDAFGCMVETRTTCTDTMFGFCDADGTPPACSTAATDPCMGVTECGTASSRSCADASTLEVCAPNAFGCYVSTPTDCTATSEVCSETSGMAMCVDPCSLVTTCASTSSCEGDDLVTCAPDGDGCLVESGRTTCADTCDPSGTPSCATTSCTPARPGFLNCGSGTVSGNTAMGMALNDGAYGDCGVAGDYPGAEEYWRFRNDDATRMAVTIVATPITSAEDFDLFALDAGDGSATCDSGTLACLDAGLSLSGMETVEFSVAPGELAYVVYDIYTSSTATTDYTLAVSCTPIVCGDSVIVGDEACDDGNTTAGDGCSDTCTSEPGYECTGEPSTCTLVCGNGTLDASAGEECDDANTTPGDGCSATCATEPGYTCTGAGAGSCVMTASNATCAGGTAITATTTLAGETTAAGGARPTGTGCGTGGDSGHTLYYAVTIPAGQEVRVALTYGTATDLLLFTMSDCTTTNCASVVDLFPPGQESLTLSNTGASSITRIVGVGPYDPSDGGTYDIAFTYTTPTTAPNATCATATAVATSTTITGEDTDEGGLRPTGPSCGTGTELSDTLYYAVTIPAGQVVTVALTYGTATDLLLFTQSACTDTDCGSVSDLFPPGEETLTINNPGATPITRIVGVGPYDTGNGGTYDIAFTYATIPAGDTCGTATAVTATGSFSGTTVGFSNDYTLPSSGCTGFGTPGADVAYAVTLAAGQTLSATVTPEATFDPALYILTDCAMTSSCVDGDDSGFDGDSETVTHTALLPTTVFLIVDSWSSSEAGTFMLDVTITP